MQWVFLVAFGLCSPVFQAFHLEKDYVIDHVEPVLNFNIIGKNENSRTLTSGHHQPHSDRIQLSFTAYNKDWSFDLEVFHGLFSPTTVFNFIGNENIVIKPNHTVYKTRKGVIPVATVNIHDDDTIHAMIGTEEDHFTIDPASMFPEFDLKSKMGIFRYGHVQNMKVKFPSYSSGSRSLLQQDFKSPLPATYPKSSGPAEAADQGDPTKWKNCNQNLETTDLKFSMGFAITNEYYTTKGGGTIAGIQNEIQNLLADSNTIYTPQMGVHLYVETADIRTTTSTAGAPWNLANTQRRNSGCGQTASAALEQFRAWREAKTGAEDVGLWHLMTTCFPPSGTVGIAYLRALCRPQIASGLTSSGTRFTWTVLAHEIGHNFGGEHSFELGQGRTGGIMDYGPGTLNNIYQFNSVYRERQICQTISSSINSQINNQGTALCWDTYNPQASANTYEWKSAADEAVCSVTCGTGTETTPFRCFRTNPTPEIKVADGNCTLTKPQATTGTCTREACPTARCGDGSIQLTNGEECDPPGSCCTQDCKVVVSNDCSMNFDSCFNSVKNVADTYCFSGTNYYKYGLTGYEQQAGYPRNIAQYFPGLPTNFGTALVDFTNNIDAVVQRKEGRLYFIKGANFAVYELGFGTHNTLPDNPQMLTKQFFGLPDGWEKIETAVSTRSGQGGAYLFRQFTLGSGNDVTAAFEYCGFRFGGTCGTPRPLTDWNQGNQWPMAGITSAVRYWPDAAITKPEVDLSVDMFYQGQYVRYKFGVGLTIPLPQNVPKPTTTIEEVAVGEPGCSVGCLTCPNSACTKCDVDFVLVNSKCQPLNYIVEMLFDQDTLAADKAHVGSTSVLNSMWSAVEGNVKQAITLVDSDYISLDVARLPTNKMEDFEFHFWVKLNNDASTSSVNLVALDLDKGTRSYQASFYLSQFVDKNQIVDQNTYRAFYQIVDKNDPDTRVQSLGIPRIPKDKWVHLIATLKQGMISCTIEGEKVELPFIDGAADGEAQAGVKEYWKFNEFIIGDTKNQSANAITSQFQGISGYLDQFHIDDLSSDNNPNNPGSPTSNDPSSAGMAYPSVLLLVVAVVFQI